MSCDKTCKYIELQNFSYIIYYIYILLYIQPEDGF
jgi:hypothetical protein